jgi:hypothetical protein
MLVFVELLALQYNITSNDYFVCWETNSHLRFSVYRLGGQIGNFFDVFSANWRQLAIGANWAMPITFHCEHGFPDWQK